MVSFWSFLAVLVACHGNTPVDSGAVDYDGDGYSELEDCNDENSQVHPGAVEVPYDNLDNDCDPVTLDDDLDGDGWLAAGDCDDNDARRYPDADEVCDGIDNDCDGLVDDADSPLVGAPVWSPDADGDGWGSSAGVNLVEACTAPEGYLEDTSDCDDDDASVSPDGWEICDGVDNDCDDELDEELYCGPEGTWTAVAAGRDFVCALDADGYVSCWGDDTYGQVSDAPDERMLEVQAGYDFACGITQGAQNVRCWGRDTAGQVSGPPVDDTSTHWGHLVLGPDSACAVGNPRGVETLACWGNEAAGELVAAEEAWRTGVRYTKYMLVASAVCGWTPGQGGECWAAANQPAAAFTLAPEAAELDIDLNNVCHLDAGGQATCEGQGHDLTREEPAAGGLHDLVVSDFRACALDIAGHAHCWGSPADNDSPPAVPLQSVSAVDELFCGVVDGGYVTCWGPMPLALEDVVLW